MSCHPKQKPTPEMICHHLLIEFDDTTPEVPIKEEAKPVKREIPDKLLQLFRKYKAKWTWRTKQLALPKVPPTIKEEIPSPRVSPKSSKVKIKKPGECPMRVSHLARHTVRYLRSNKNQFKFLGKKFVKRMDKVIESSWNSIYNYYAKSELELAKRRSKRSLKKKASKTSKSSAKSEKDLEEWMKRISKPKEVPKPAPLPPRKQKPLSDMLDHVDEISKPKVIEGYIPPREMPIPIKKEALTYEMTEGMASLAGKIPDRFKMKPEPEHPPGYVNPTALKYKITPAVEKLAVPKEKMVGNVSDVREDAFVISPNALKYKATARIQELAQPISRS